MFSVRLPLQLIERLGTEFKRSGPSDKKAIVTGLTRAMRVRRRVERDGARIGFAGPRVIEQTIREKLPDGFQRSEFLLEHGMVDMIRSRSELRESLIPLLDFFSAGVQARSSQEVTDETQSAAVS